MSNDADNSAPAPVLPQSPADPQRDERGRLKRGNTNGKWFAPGNPSRSKHGLSVRKPAKFDKRLSVDRMVIAAMRAWEESLGERLTAQRAAIIANIGKRCHDVAKMEAYERQLVHPYNPKTHAAWPITELRLKTLDAIDRALERVGLERTETKPTSLNDIIARHSESNESR